MRRRTVALVIGLGAALLAPAGVRAARDDWYRDVRPWLDRRSESEVRRAQLIDRDLRLRDEVRTAERRRDISTHDADRLYDRLDRVARFLRDDQHLSNSEYKRRRNDLDHVEDDLRRDIGHRSARLGRYR